MSCIFPGAADLQGYWRLLLRGEDAVTEVPPTHWQTEDYLDRNGSKPDHLYCNRGGYIDAVNFDPAEFGIPPTNLEATDTSQLLGLVAAKKALEDAGYGAGQAFERRRTSVILGVTGTQELVLPLAARLGHPLWRRALAACGLNDMQVHAVVERIAAEYVPWQENSFPGLLGNVVAGRISNRLDLGGTNCVVDAACASSFSALHLALLELDTRRSDMVLTGGVDTLNDVFMHACFCNAHILSPSGEIRPFSAQADGTLLGEGLGMLVLKRLVDARRDGNKIYAVIKGLGTSSDGRSQSIYAPNRAGQVQALRAAYAQARIEPLTVGLLEAHGTGTRVGDQVEFQALCDVFGIPGDDTAQQPWCALGSVKSMIGHTKAAAGTAGLIKAVLALHHKVLPPTLKAGTPDPRLNLDQSPFYLNTCTRPWLADPRHPRRAGVSAFGFGGSNFHVVVEEYQEHKSDSAWPGAVQLLAFAADNVAGLKTLLEQQVQVLQQDLSTTGLAAWAAATRRIFSRKHPHRLVLAVGKPIDPQVNFAAHCCELMQQALEWLQQPDDRPDPPGLFYGRGAAAPLALIFPGQGSQYVAMGADLLAVFPVALQTLQQLDDLCRALGYTPVGPLMYPPPAAGADGLQQQENLLRRTEHAQPAIGAISMAMLALLRSFGLDGCAFGGHSYGELTALYAAGWMDADAFRTLSLARGRCMADAASRNGAGAMLAVNAPLEQLDELVRTTGGDVVLANRNAPEQGILSGTQTAVAHLESLCRARGYSTRSLPVAAAFHSTAMAPARQTFERVLADCTFTPNTQPVISSITGALLPTDPAALRALLARQLTDPVDFVTAIKSLYQSGIRTFVEVGPKAVLTGLVRNILDGDSHLALALDASAGRTFGLMDLACLLARLAADGYPVTLPLWEPGQPGVHQSAPKMQIPICGANYRSPMTAPKPAGVTSEAPVNHRQVDPPAAVADLAGEPVRTVPQEPYMPEIETEAMNTSTPPSLPNHVSQDGLESVFQAVQEGLASLQALQRQTAETHQMFLQHQTESSRTLQQMISGIQRLAENALGIAPDTRRTFANLSPASGVTAPVSPPDAVPSRVVAPRTAPTFAGPATNLTNELPAPAVLQPPPTPNGCIATPSLAESAACAPAPIPVTTPDANATATDLAAHLLAVVSELTGYPVAMLGLDMDIEADLGIDSIKRVEILSAMEERLPHLPPVSPEIMGTLKTLQQILQQFEDTSGSPAASSRMPAPESVCSLKTDDTDLAAHLLAVVSELTGYPVAMLGLDMDIEADLGIDSIKRVEILSAMEERLPHLPPVSPEIMGTLKTLQQILDCLAAPAAAATSNTSATFQATASAVFSGPCMKCPDPAPPQAPGSALKEADSTKDTRPPARKTVHPAEFKLTFEAPISLPEHHAVVVVGNDAVLGQSIAAALSRQGVRADWQDMAAALKAFRGMAAVAGLVLVAETGATFTAASTFLIQAFELVRKAAPALRRAAAENAGLLAAVTRLDGAFGFKGPVIGCAYSGGLAGLIKTAAREWPEVTCRVVDLDTAWQLENDACADDLAGVLLAPSGALPVEIGLDSRLPQHSAWRLELRDSPLPAGETEDPGPAPCLQPNDVILVSGGARGITAATMTELAAFCQPRLVLLGRSPEPFEEPQWLTVADNEAALKQALLQHEFANGTPAPLELEARFRHYSYNREIRRNLEALRIAGAAVTYYSVDIREQTQVEHVAERVRRELGPIRAIIHGAGVLADRRIEEKSTVQFRDVFDTKVLGLEALLNATRDDPLTHLIAFSSVTARFGNVGQADYAVANEVVNKRLQQEARRRSGCRVLSINWGPWAGGMVTPALQQEFQRRNVALIPVGAGARALVAELVAAEQPPPVEIIIGGTNRPDAMPQPLTLTFKREVDVNGMPVLQAHQLNNVPVMPLALIAEWLSHGALHQHPGMVLQGLDNLQVLKGLRLDQPRRMVRVLAGKADRRADIYEVPVELRDGVKSDQDLVHSRARAILADSLLVAPSFDYSRYQDAPPYKGTLLRDLYGRVLFHGEALQGLRDIISLTPDFMVARVATAPPPASWMKNPLRSRWIGDPLVLDGAFQMGIIWCHDQLGRLSLPSFAARYRQYCRRFPEQDVTVVMEITHTGSHKIKGNFTFLDDSRTVLARLEGYEAVMDESLRQAFGLSL